MQAQAKTKFKKTPIGEIPEDWDVKPLSEVAEYINGYAFSPKDWKDRGLPIIRIQNLNDPKAEFNYFEGEIDEKYIVKDGDLLFSWSASIGVYIWNRGKAVLNQHIFKVIPKKGIDKLYLYYAMFLAIEQLKNRIHGSTMKHFKKGELKRTFIPIPPLPEQKKIAEILRTVDEAIEKTDEAIERTERLKKGLMRRLLTRGIGHERFKKTELGEIPEEWEVVRLEKLLNAIQDTPHKVPKKSNTGIPFVSVNYVLQFPDYNFYIDHSRAGIEYISEDNIEFIKKFTPEPGDVIYTKWGTPGIAKLVNTKDRFVGLCSLALLKPKRSLVYPLFLVYALNSNSTRKQIIPHSKTSTRTEIHKKHIKNILLPLPPLEEQKQIAEIISTVDRRLELLRQRREKLERVKRGLMKDLLTGRRRVSV